jgi:hypothetical protein
MTHLYCNIPYIGGSNVCYPIRTKNSSDKPETVKLPFAMTPHNRGVLYGMHPNPPKFQNCDSSNQLAMMRKYRSADDKKSLTPLPSSMYAMQQKWKSGGKLSASGASSYKSFDENTSRSALRRVRNSSCVAPAKKGAMY